MAETGFSQIDRVQNRGTFLWTVIKKDFRSNYQVTNSFFRISSISVPCPHAQLKGRTVNWKLWTFFGPWGRDRSQSQPCWIFRVQQIHHSTASGSMERTTRLSSAQLWGYDPGYDLTRGLAGRMVANWWLRHSQRQHVFVRKLIRVSYDVTHHSHRLCCVSI